MPLDLAYRLLAVKFNLMHIPTPYTKEFLEILKIIYTPQEAWLAALMPPIPVSARTIARLQGKNPEDMEQMLLDMADRGLVFECTRNGRRSYMLLPLIPGVLEMQLMDGVGTPKQRLLAQKIHEMFENHAHQFYSGFERINSSFARVIPVEKSVASASQILPYEDVRSIIRQGKKFAVSHCYCRQEKKLLGIKHCSAPVDLCLSLDFGADFLIKHKIGLEVSQDEMFAKLDLAEEHNLVHMVDNNLKDFSFICNCCGCCCGILGSVTRFDHRPACMVSTKIAKWDETKCTHCGKCARVCQATALTFINKTLIYAADRCIGCGLCIAPCPSGALQLTEREHWEKPQPTYGDMVIDMMSRRVKANFMLPGRRIPGGDLAAKFINRFMAEAE